MVKCPDAIATEKLRWGDQDWLMFPEGGLTLPNSLTIECFCSHGKLESDGEKEKKKRNQIKTEYSISFILPPLCIFILLSTGNYLTCTWWCLLQWVQLLLPRREWREVCCGNHSESSPPLKERKNVCQNLTLIL